MGRSSSESSASSSDSDDSSMSSSSSSSSGEEEVEKKVPVPRTPTLARAPPTISTKQAVKMPVRSPAVKVPAAVPSSSSTPTAPIATTATVNNTTSTTSTSSGSGSSAMLKSVNPLYRNPQLNYKAPDRDPIPLPARAHQSAILQTFLADKVAYPPLQYRHVDYWIGALDLFLMALDDDYDKQKTVAAKNRRDFKKFTWGNKGELAICFALVMDMLKLLHDKLATGANRPSWDVMVDQFISLVVRVSKIPTDILTEGTYQTKYRDWKSGGTRYDTAHQTANIRFPAAQERLRKLETYIQSGNELEVHVTVVAAEEPTVPVVAETKEPRAPPSSVTGAVSKAMVGPGPIVRGKEPPRVAAVKQPLPDPNAPLLMTEWYSQFHSIKGGPSMLLLPRDRIHKMPDLLRLGRVSNHPEQFVTVMDLVHHSTEDVQRAFESEMGLQLARSWVDTSIRVKNASAVRQIVERVASLRIVGWSEASKQAWMGGSGGPGANLDWLRAVDLPMTIKPQVWHDMIQRLESVLSVPSLATSSAPSSSSSAQLITGQKRARDEDIGSQQPQQEGTQLPPPPPPEVVRCRTAVVPRAVLPTSATLAEARTMQAMMEKRVQLSERHQQALATLAANAGVDARHPIPTLHDPFSLLGIRCVPQL